MVPAGLQQACCARAQGECSNSVRKRRASLHLEREHTKRTKAAERQISVANALWLRAAIRTYALLVHPCNLNTLQGLTLYPSGSTTANPLPSCRARAGHGLVETLWPALLHSRAAEHDGALNVSCNWSTYTNSAKSQSVQLQLSSRHSIKHDCLAMQVRP